MTIAVVTIPKSYSSALMAYAKNEKGMYVGPTNPSDNPERYPEGDLEHFYFHFYIEDSLTHQRSLYDWMWLEFCPNVNITNKVSLKKIDIIKMPIHYYKVLEYYKPEKWIVPMRDPLEVAKNYVTDDEGNNIKGLYAKAVKIQERFLKEHPEAILVDMNRFMSGDTSEVDEALDGKEAR